MKGAQILSTSTIKKIKLWRQMENKNNKGAPISIIGVEHLLNKI